MDENLNPSEGQEAIVEPQIDVVDTGVKDSQVADVKPVQSQEDNAKYADMRRKTESETKDKMIAEMYGSQGINTYSEYQKAMADQKETEDNAKFQQDNGFDPNSVKPLFEQWKQSDPDFQELSSIREEKNISKALTDLNSELKDCGIDLQLNDLSTEEVAKIPNVDKVTELVRSGKTLAEAVFLANKKDFFAKQTATAQQDTIRKITANGASSPGSLGGGGEGQEKTVYSMSKDDFKKMQDEVMRGDRKKI